MKKTKATTRSAASRRLHAMDTAAEFVVTSGGFLVLSAVLGICLYLFWVVLPLFEKGAVGEEVLGSVSKSAQTEWVAVDPYQHVASLVDENLNTTLIMLETGEVIGEIGADDLPGTITASSYARDGEFIALGYDNGQVQFGKFEYGVKLKTPPEELEQGDVVEYDFGYIEVLEPGRGRVVELTRQLGDPIEFDVGEGPVAHVDYRKAPSGKEVRAVMREDGTVLVSTVRTIRPLGGGNPTKRRTTKSFSCTPPLGRDKPEWMVITADSDYVLMLWADGRCDRYARGDDKSFRFVETAQFADEGTKVNAANMLLGSMSLLIGQDDGRMGVYHIADDVLKTNPDDPIVRLFSLLFAFLLLLKKSENKTKKRNTKEKKAPTGPWIVPGEAPGAPARISPGVRAAH